MLATVGIGFEALAFGLFLLWLVLLIPAAVVTLLKQRYLMFVAGFFTLGVIWIIAAFALAEPDSGWARRFYGPQRMARAENPERNPRSPRNRLAWVGGVLAALTVLGLSAARPAPLLGLDGEALGSSVGGSSLLPCEKRPDGEWNCRYSSSRSSEMIEYRVRVDGVGCWTATPAERSGGGGGFRRLSGCLTLLGYVL